MDTLVGQAKADISGRLCSLLVIYSVLRTEYRVHVGHSGVSELPPRSIQIVSYSLFIPLIYELILSLYS